MPRTSNCVIGSDPGKESPEARHRFQQRRDSLDLRCLHQLGHASSGSSRLLCHLHVKHGHGNSFVCKEKGTSPASLPLRLAAQIDFELRLAG